MQKGPPLGDKKLKTKEKKKTEIKREKHLFQPKFCKFKETPDCRTFLELYQNVSMYVGVVSSCCFDLSISFSVIFKASHPVQENKVEL